MAEISFTNPNATLVWINETDQVIFVTCQGLPDAEVAPGMRVESPAFRAINNTAAEMAFAFADGSPRHCTIRWRTVADKFVLTRETDGSPESAVKMVEKENLLYCLTLTPDTNAPGIVIVGTIDTK